MAVAGCSAQAEEHEPPTETASPDRAAQWEAVLQAEQRSIDCMAERGLPPTMGDDGRPQYPGIPGDEGDERLLSALSECSEEAGFPEHTPYTPEEQERLYELEVERIACIETFGVEVVAELPSLETYLAQQQNPQLDPLAFWDPLAGAEVPAGIDLMEVQESCPTPGLAQLAEETRQSR